MRINPKQQKKIILLALLAAWFYIIPILYQFIFVNNDNPEKVIAKIQQNQEWQEKKFQNLINNTKLLAKFYTGNYDDKALDDAQKLPFAFQLYQEFSDSTFELRFWNSNNVLPTKNELLYQDGSFIVKKENGYHQFRKQTFVSGDTKIITTSLFPIYAAYFIETDYLQPKFAAGAGLSKKYKLTTTPTIYPIPNKNGLTELYLLKVTDTRNIGYSWVYLLGRSISLVLLLCLFYQIGIAAIQLKNFVVGLVTLIVLLILARLLCFYTNFLFEYKVIEYFDPSIYAANNIFKSLGDLTFNLLFFFVTILFWQKNYTPLAFGVNKSWKGIVYKDVLKAILFVWSSFFTIWIFRSVISYSKISFNVTNFFSLSVYSIIGFLHIAFLIVTYYLFTQKVLRISKLFEKQKIVGYVLLIILGLVLLFANVYWAKDSISIFFLGWILVYFFVSSVTTATAKESQFSFPIYWLLFFSFFAAILFNYENNKKEKVDRIALARKLAFQSDPNTESLLSIALAKFDNNFLQKNTQTFYNAAKASMFKDTLLLENFVGYLNKFQTTIYTYDSLEKPLYNKDSASYSYFNALFQNQSTAVRGIADLGYLEIGFDLFSYIFKRPILDTAGKVTGHFIVQANPITYKNKSAALSPELFKLRNNRLADNGNNYVYAIYNKYELRKRFFDYDLPTKITPSEMPIQDDTIKVRNGVEELWWKFNKDSAVVVGKKSNNLIALITLFAYIFFSILFTLLILALVNLLVLQKPTKQKLRELVQINFSKQVQGIVWVVSLLTFIVVAFVIISLFKTRFNKTNKERLGRTMSILIADVQNKLNTNSVFDDVVKIYEPGANEALKETIFQMSEIHNVDFNIYDLEGTLKLSSQPLIETKGILSNKMNPLAFFNLRKKASAQVVQQEKIGSFEYLSMYVPIRDEQGKAYGYLNIPYYSSQSDLNQEISNFLITIINLTAFIFLIAGLIAWLVTNRITNSFQLIGNKMKEVGLGKNERIEWNKDDEIGDLVKEYNKMVLKLEESANTLAKTERESAWREMARQVAHEIKNPLTPMKLSIQYLQKSIANGNANIETLADNVSKTLVEQIDHLSNIASDFSQFANIGNSKLEKIDLLEMLVSLQQLFNTESNVVITLHNNAVANTIIADKTQINRLFTNLIKNAIQAYEETALKKIDVIMVSNNDNIIIIVKDYGKGIPEHLKPKIFTPNFTTKSSGTGLGLAISKGIVENARGTINFETEEGKGTSFITNFAIFKQ